MSGGLSLGHPPLMEEVLRLRLPEQAYAQVHRRALQHCARSTDAGHDLLPLPGCISMQVSLALLCMFSSFSLQMLFPLLQEESGDMEREMHESLLVE